MGKQTSKATMRMVETKLRGEKRIVGAWRNAGAEQGLNFWKVHLMVDRLNEKFGTKVKLIGPQEADRVLNDGTDNWRTMIGPSPFVVDAGIAFEKGGRKLGNEIVFAYESDPRVIVPTGKYKGANDVALVILGLNAGDFKEDGNDVRMDVPDSRIVVIENIPRKSGWHMPHPETTVPQGKQVEASAGARYFARHDDAYAGLLVRFAVGYGYDCGQGVDAGHRSSLRFGVALEIPKGDAAKFSAPVPATKEKKDEKAVIEVPEISIAQLSNLYQGATEAVERMSGAVDATVLEPIREFLSAIGKARF